MLATGWTTCGEYSHKLLCGKAMRNHKSGFEGDCCQKWGWFKILKGSFLFTTNKKLMERIKHAPRHVISCIAGAGMWRWQRWERRESCWYASWSMFRTSLVAVRFGYWLKVCTYRRQAMKRMVSLSLTERLRILDIQSELRRTPLLLAAQVSQLG